MVRVSRVGGVKGRVLGLGIHCCVGSSGRTRVRESCLSLRTSVPVGGMWTCEERACAFLLHVEDDTHFFLVTGVTALTDLAIARRFHIPVRLELT